VTIKSSTKHTIQYFIIYLSLNFNIINLDSIIWLLFYAASPELLLSFLSSGSITTPSLVKIMVLSLLIEADNELSCFSSLMSR